MRIRLLVVGVAFALSLAAIGARAVHLQVYRGPMLSRMAAGEYESSRVTRAKRGTIYDRNYQEMAVSIDVASIGAHPGQFQASKKQVAALARILDLKISRLNRRLAAESQFIWIKRHVSPREVAEVKKMGLKGVNFLPAYRRYYPNRGLAAQVLGFTGVDGNGLEGIEFRYNRQLKGNVDRMRVLRDARGRLIDLGNDRVADSAGHNLVLTIDRTVQFITERTLQEAVQTSAARAGMAVVLEPATGAVLAMAQVPGFNPNSYSAFDRQTWRNRVITDPFEPGSTMKIFLAAAAIEAGKSGPETSFNCENGSYRIGNNTIREAGGHRYGNMTLQQIVQRSSNIGAVKISQAIGARVLYETLRRFGFGEKTAVDCPGETAGSLAPYQSWSKMDAGAIAFGQGISVSALQLVAAMAVIANDGVFVKPYIVQAVTDPNGRFLKNTAPCRVRRVVSAATARKMARILTTVTSEGGTGIRAALKGYAVGGKTGTAQKADGSGTYAADRYVASFVGYAPVEQPAVAILVVIDEPRREHYGGVVAAPAFQKIAQKTLDYLGTSPQHENNRLLAGRNQGVQG